MPVTNEPPAEDLEVVDPNRKGPPWIENLEHIIKMATTDSAEAMAELKELSYRLDNDARPLPAIIPLGNVTEDDMIPPPELLHDCLYQGGKLLLAAASKARKTWILIDLIVSIASGVPWLGIGTTRSNVLLLDLELMEFEVYKRLKLVMDKRGITDTGGIDVWALRGHPLTLERLKAQIIAHCKKRSIGLIAFDPYYRLGEGCDENANGEIAKFLAQLEEIAHETGAAIALTHHFAKGNSGVKNSIDRMSGAGTFARDPDALLSMTEQENSKSEDPIFVAEFTVRSFKPIAAFSMRWEFPIWIRDDRLGTSLKGATGRPSGVGSVEDMAALLEYDAEIRTGEFQGLAATEFGISKNKFYQLLKELKATGSINERVDGRARHYSLDRSKAVYGKTYSSKSDHPATQAELIG